MKLFLKPLKPPQLIFSGCLPFCVRYHLKSSTTLSRLSIWALINTKYLVEPEPERNQTTGDGRNPKQPPGMYKTLKIIGYLPYQLVSRISSIDSSVTNHIYTTTTYNNFQGPNSWVSTKTRCVVLRGCWRWRSTWEITGGHVIHGYILYSPIFTNDNYISKCRSIIPYMEHLVIWMFLHEAINQFVSWLIFSFFKLSNIWNYSPISNIVSSILSHDDSERAAVDHCSSINIWVRDHCDWFG